MTGGNEERGKDEGLFLKVVSHVYKQPGCAKSLSTPDKVKDPD